LTAARREIALLQERLLEAAQALGALFVEVPILVAEIEVPVEDCRAQVGEVLDLVRGAQPGRDEGQRDDEEADQQSHGSAGREAGGANAPGQRGRRRFSPVCAESVKAGAPAG
jgi:hypothetical protein